MARYELTHWVIRKSAHESTATVHLHGDRKKLFGGVERHIDYVTLGILPMETDAEIVRCSIALSPHEWHVNFGRNISYFGGKFIVKIDDRLRTTLTIEAANVSSSNDA